MWAYESVFYQFYPLGFCAAFNDNNTEVKTNISKVIDWIPHLKKIGVDAVYFSPIFESDFHGYDTKDYFNIDHRLGTNADFANVCKELHNNNIKVVLDGVFNHVGRGFWAFQDVLKNREASLHKDWFDINFSGNSNYNDGLWYEGWEGHYDLVKLNLKNNNVIEHLLSAIKFWVDEFDIDGLRLDVAYCLDRDFIKRLRSFCNDLKQDFVLIGEVIFSEGYSIVNENMLHSCTNYECYKGMFSSFNDMNMFEISYSLNRQFGPEDWSVYKDKHLMAFVDNHDVTRIASILKEKKHLPLIYTLLFTMPGIPCLYYGSEWGAEGKKEDGDINLRPAFNEPIENELTELISKLSKIHKESKAICYGSYKNLIVTNEQLVFERTFENERIVVAINANSVPYTVNLNLTGTSLLSGNRVENSFSLPPYSVECIKQ